MAKSAEPVEQIRFTSHRITEAAWTHGRIKAYPGLEDTRANCHVPAEDLPRLYRSFFHRWIGKRVNRSWLIYPASPMGWRRFPACHNRAAEHQVCWLGVRGFLKLNQPVHTRENVVIRKYN